MLKVKANSDSYQECSGYARKQMFFYFVTAKKVVNISRNNRSNECHILRNNILQKHEFLLPFQIAYRNIKHFGGSLGKQISYSFNFTTTITIN